MVIRGRFTLGNGMAHIFMVREESGEELSPSILVRHLLVKKSRTINTDDTRSVVRLTRDQYVHERLTPCSSPSQQQ